MFLCNPFPLIDKKLARLKDCPKSGNVVVATVAGVSKFCPKIVKNVFMIQIKNVDVRKDVFKTCMGR